jgi:hypothetical protein
MWLGGGGAGAAWLCGRAGQGLRLLVLEQGHLADHLHNCPFERGVCHTSSWSSLHLSPANHVGKLHNGKRACRTTSRRWNLEKSSLSLKTILSEFFHFKFLLIAQMKYFNFFHFSMSYVWLFSNFKMKIIISNFKNDFFQIFHGGVNDFFARPEVGKYI